MKERRWRRSWSYLMEMDYSVVACDFASWRNRESLNKASILVYYQRAGWDRSRPDAASSTRSWMSSATVEWLPWLPWLSARSARDYRSQILRCPLRSGGSTRFRSVLQLSSVDKNWKICSFPTLLSPKENCFRQPRCKPQKGYVKRKAIKGYERWRTFEENQRSTNQSRNFLACTSWPQRQTQSCISIGRATSTISDNVSTLQRFSLSPRFVYKCFLDIFGGKYENERREKEEKERARSERRFGETKQSVSSSMSLCCFVYSFRSRTSRCGGRPYHGFRVSLGRRIQRRTQQRMYWTGYSHRVVSRRRLIRRAVISSLRLGCVV